MAICFIKKHTTTYKKQITKSINMAISLHTLPVDLIYRILDHLDERTLFLSFINVCSRLNTIIDTYHPYQVNFNIIFERGFFSNTFFSVHFFIMTRTYVLWKSNVPRFHLVDSRLHETEVLFTCVHVARIDWTAASETAMQISLLKSWHSKKYLMLFLNGLV